MAVTRSRVNMQSSDTRNIVGLKEHNVPAAFCDAVRIELAEYVQLHISGQTPVDDDGNLVSGDMKAQTGQVLARIKRIVEHEGGTMADIVRFRVYCTDISPQALRQVHEARNEVFGENERPASTLVQISGIIRAGALIEIDADAVIDR